MRPIFYIIHIIRLSSRERKGLFAAPGAPLSPTELAI